MNMKSTHAMIILAIATPQLVTAEPVSRVIYTSPPIGRTRILRSISDDGNYVVHERMLFVRNNSGKVQFEDRDGKGGLVRPTWRTGVLQAVRRTTDGSVAYVVSHIIDSGRGESEGPFAKPLCEFERTLYKTPKDAYTRFPTSRGVEIESVFFGGPDIMRVTMGPYEKSYSNGEINLKTGEKATLPRSQDFPRSKTIQLFDGKGYISCLRGVRVFEFSRNRPPVSRALAIDARNRGRARRSDYGSVAIGEDNRTLLANYSEGLLLWEFSGKLNQKQTVSFPNEGGQRHVALLPGKRAFVITGDGNAALINMATGKTLTTRKLAGVNNIVSDSCVAVQTASSAQYICLRASSEGNCAICLKIEKDQVLGPWFVPDVPNQGKLQNVIRIRSARQAPIMVVETEGNDEKNGLPRLIAVDLDELTKQAPL
jgi:hypothetical protein